MREREREMGGGGDDGYGYGGFIQLTPVRVGGETGGGGDMDTEDLFSKKPYGGGG